MTELHDLLDRATDRIESPAEPQHAATAALARARVARTRRRSLVAGAVVVAAVVAVVVASGVVGGTERTDAPVGPVPTVPAVPDSAVQATWDPRDAGGLPQLDSSVLPPRIERPAEPIELPLSGPASLAFADGQERIQLLASDGRWAWTQAPSGSARLTSLSDDGTMLANMGDGKLFVTDVRYGGYHWRQLELPEPANFWTTLAAHLQWRGDTQVVVSSSIGGGVAVVDVEGAGATRPHRLGLIELRGYTEGPDGTGVAFGNVDEGRVIREVRNGEVVISLAANALESVWRPVASDSRVAGVVSGLPQKGGPTDHAGILVLDRDGYDTVAFLPIARTTYTPGVSDTVSAGGVAPVAWLDDRTLLLSTNSASLGDPWVLVAWDVESGELSRVSVGGPEIDLVGAAAGVLAD